MPQYIVRMHQCTVTWEVTAESPEDAQRIAWLLVDDGLEPSDLDYDGAIVQVREKPASRPKETP